MGIKTKQKKVLELIQTQCYGQWHKMDIFMLGHNKGNKGEGRKLWRTLGGNAGGHVNKDNLGKESRGKGRCNREGYRGSLNAKISVPLNSEIRISGSRNKILKRKEVEEPK